MPRLPRAKGACTPPGGFSSCAGLLRWTLQASIGRLGGHLWWLASAPGPACFRDPIARAQGRESPASRVQSTAGGRSAARSTGAMAAWSLRHDLITPAPGGSL